jgi:type I restriction enzyme S subunit
MSLPSYTGYKDSGVEWLGEVPLSWEIKQVRHLIRGSSEGMKIGPFGSQLKVEMLDDDGEYKVYGQENVIADDFERGDRFLSAARFAELNAYEVSSGDILVTMMGSSGRCAIAPAGLPPGIMDSHLLRIRVNRNVLPRFLRLLIDDAAYVAYQVKVLGKGSIMHGLNSEIVKKLVVVLPSISEQYSLLKFLDRETRKIDALVKEQQRLIELLKEKRQAVISHAVTKGLNPNAPMKASGIEWLGEVPAHWEVGPLKRFWKVTDCKHVTAEFVEEGIPLASIREVQAWWVTLENAKRTTEFFYDQLIEGGRKPMPGDLIFSRNATVGEVAQVSEEHPAFAMGQDVCLLRKTDPRHSSDFLQHVIRSSAVLAQLQNLMIGSTFKRVNVEEIKSLIVPMPPACEQSVIATHLSAECSRIDILISQATRAIDLLQERRTALVSSAVTGKIDVRGLVEESVA